jgi:hypothetical protein
MVCLKALEQTDVNYNKKLDVFLSSQITARPELATLKLKKHSWIGLLKDIVNNYYITVFGDACLEFNYQTGVICKGLSRSVFRTTLIINRLSKPNGLIKKYVYRHEAIKL